MPPRQEDPNLQLFRMPLLKLLQPNPTACNSHYFGFHAKSTTSKGDPVETFCSPRLIDRSRHPLPSGLCPEQFSNPATGRSPTRRCARWGRYPLTASVDSDKGGEEKVVSERLKYVHSTSINDGSFLPERGIIYLSGINPAGGN